MATRDPWSTLGTPPPGTSDPSNRNRDGRRNIDPKKDLPRPAGGNSSTWGPHYETSGVHGTGGGLFGLGGGGMPFGLGGGGSNVDTPNSTEAMNLFLPMLKQLQDAGIINPLAGGDAMANWQKAQATQLAKDKAYREKKIGQYTPKFTSRIAQALVERGMDPATAQRYAQEQANLTSKGVPVGVANASQYYGQSALDTALTNVEKAAQDRLTSGINAAMPANYGRTAFADTADDAFIQSLIENQMKDARGSLDMQMKRGVLDNTGYQAALAELERQKAGATSRAQDIGGGILGQYRTDLDAFGQTLRDEQMANPFTGSAGGIADALKARQSEYMGRMQGDIRNALGSAPLFNVNTLSQAGASKQGQINPAGLTSATGFRDALAARQKMETGGRGLGSSGVF